jgi:uncharacterized membrane protein
MPYRWQDTAPNRQELHLWPHQSLPPRGFALFIGITFAMSLMPLIAVIGSAVLWGLLPFMLLALWGIWFALNRSRRHAQVIEVLTLSQDTAHLLRQNPRGDVLEWECNRYWAKPALHEQGGPVPQYVTLSGNGREVEIGAFLSEDERVALYDDLTRALARI